MDPDSERDFAQRPSATDRERAGRRIDTATEIPPKMRQARHFFTEAEVAEGWQGTSPAEGTRRHLILETIRGFANDLIGDVDLSGADTLLELADRVETALLQSAIDDEARSRLAEALTDGIVEVDLENRAGRSVAGEEAAKALNHLIIARRECVDPAELARLNEAITAAHMVIEPPSFTAVAEAVDREVAGNGVKGDPDDLRRLAREALANRIADERIDPAELIRVAELGDV